MSDLVRRTDLDGVATIELHRPERRNAIVPPMLDELAAAVADASADTSVGAVLLCGAGGAFCSGLDLKEYGAQPPPAWLATSAQSVRRAHVALAECPHPIVVALERYAINGGAAFALAGDLIVTGTDAWLQVGEVRLGMAAPMNLAWLTARYPLSTVLQIVLSGNRCSGRDMHRLGIAHEVVADHDVRNRAEALAAEIASYPPGTAALLKSAAVRLAGARTVPDASWFDLAAEVAPATLNPLTTRAGDGD